MATLLRLILPSRCPLCACPREERECADCGAKSGVIDCEHYVQPVAIAPSHFGDRAPTCDACEQRRWERSSRAVD